MWHAAAPFSPAVRLPQNPWIRFQQPKIIEKFRRPLFLTDPYNTDIIFTENIIHAKSTSVK